MVNSEFDFLMAEKAEELDIEVNSKCLIEQAKKIRERKTIYGIDSNVIYNQLYFDATDCMPWKHVTLRIDTSKLYDINKEGIREIRVFDFVQELDCLPNLELCLGFNCYKSNKIGNITIAPNVVVINNKTFAFYKRLKKVVFEDNCSLIRIGSEAFAYCESLKELDFRNCKYVEDIPSNLIYGSGVKVLKLPSSVKHIDEKAFEHSVLEKIYIEDEVYNIDDFMQMLKSNGYNAFWEDTDNYDF